MPAPSDFLTALGMTFTGYGKDRQQQLENDRLQQQGQMAQQLHTAQIGEYQAQAAQRQAAMADKARRQQVLAQYGKAAIQGDPDAVQQVVSVAPELAATLTKEPPKGQYDSERGVIVNPDGSVIRPHGLPVKPEKDRDRWVSAGTDPATGQPLLLNSATGETKVGGGVKSGSGGATAMQQGRLGVGKVDLEQAHERMKQYEQDVASGTEQITPALQGIGAAASTVPNDHASGLTGLIGNTIAGYGSGKAAQSIATSNPRYAQYQMDKKLVSEAILATAQRGSDAMRRFELGIAGVGAGWTPQQMKALQTRREAILHDVFGRLVPDQATHPAIGHQTAPVGAPPPIARPKSANIFLQDD